MRFNTFYGYAKQCSNELRLGIKAVEETVKSTMGPVNEKFRLVPDEIIRQANIDHAEHRSTNNAPVANRAIVSEMAVRHYSKGEPVAEQSVASAWKKVKQSPMFSSGGECGCAKGRVLHGKVQRSGYWCRGEGF